MAGRIFSDVGLWTSNWGRVKSGNDVAGSISCRKKCSLLFSLFDLEKPRASQRRTNEVSNVADDCCQTNEPKPCPDKEKSGITLVPIQ